jgi:hypothetical protein
MDRTDVCQGLVLAVFIVVVILYVWKGANG